MQPKQPTRSIDLIRRGECLQVRCSRVYRVMRLNQTINQPDGRTRTPETRSSLEARCARIRLIAQICATNSGILKFESEFT